ncbi:MAG: S1 RNA-binding domain-containing protein, partial [Planctomycetota bacterium]
ITNFGVFVELEEDLEGLLHISELADHKVDNPQEVVKLGEDIEVKILRVDSEERKIGLSLKRAQWAAEEAEKEPVPEPTRRRGGLASDGGPLGEEVIRTVRVGPEESESPEDSAAEQPQADASTEQSAPQASDETPPPEEQTGEADDQTGKTDQTQEDD